MSRLIDLTGVRMGRLIVIKRSFEIKKTVAYLCKCDCGKEKVVRRSSLRRKRPTLSCGCLRTELSKAAALYPGEEAMNGIYHIYKASAKERQYPFELTREQFKEITQGHCIYCDAKPSNISTFRNNSQSRYIYNGIDRVDNTLGYVYENCVPCCEVCNRMKKAKTLDDFISHVTKIYFHFINNTNALSA